MTGRCFIFLQGMPSPFFSRIAQALKQQGHRAIGINLCAGDALFWRGPETVHYRGTRAGWPAFLAALLQRESATDLILLGEQRDYHREAVALAQELGVRVTVTDFGYLRPDWITLERDGMSGNSRFPRDPGAIRALAARAPAPDLRRIYTDSTAAMAQGDLLYSFANVLLWFFYPHYRRSDRRAHPAIYFPSIGRRMLLAKRNARRANIAIAHLLASDAPFFVFPLQLNHDFQIVAYSDFDDMQDAITFILDSFARHASADARLVVKVHPWDPGFRNWRRAIARHAKALGVGDRVLYLDGGNLDALTEKSAGMVTVNSTSGLRALQLGRPVKTLGKAVYNVSGLVDAGTLDDFWRAPESPDADLVDAYIRAMTATIQIRGVFFSEPGLTAAVEAAATRVAACTVGEIV